MTLSTRTKESFKTGLAMTIAYGIALSMDWEKPYWAGFAVAMISLTTAGQSLNKAALRMLGTLGTTIVALVLIALFAQDRWPFMLFLSAYVGFCTYMMGGKKHQ
ncbi:MAG: FUSC family protein, partial [Desulfobacterales bacterium]